MDTTTSSNPIRAPPHIYTLLQRLHELSTEQESKITKEKTYASSQVDFDDFMRDKFIALEEDKCQLAYQLIRATGARNIVEAGTSFGVSTIYLALALGENIRAHGGEGKVIATENEPSKVKIAKGYWKECGPEVSNLIEFREGDLRETLKENLEQVDFLLLDIWSPMAFPTLQVVEPKLKKGAVILTDNTISSASRYKDLLNHFRNPVNGYTTITMPYHGGFEMTIYHGR